MGDYGKRLKMVRGEMLQEDFAKILDVHKNTLVRFETGKGKPNIEELNRILAAFPHINPTWLLTGEGNMRRESKSEVRETAPGWGSSENHPASKSDRTRVAEIGGEPVPQPEHERLDRKLLFITIARLQQVFKDFDIDDPQDQAGVITDVYSHIVEKHLDRTDETVDGLAETMQSLFSNINLLKRLPSLGLGFLSKTPGQLWNRIKK